MTGEKTVTVNGRPYKVATANGATVVNGNIMDADVKQLGPGRWHVLVGNRSYNVEMSEGRDGREMKVNGRVYPFEVQDPMTELLRSLGMSTNGTSKLTEVKAPMPGLVLRTEAHAGQVVKKGDALLVLEAMKMENVIKSPGDGTVKSIEVEVGRAVEKGQVLVRFQ
jgi:biotin carboxyl carrier protein